MRAQLASEAAGTPKHDRWRNSPKDDRPAPTEPKVHDRKWVPHLRDRWFAACNTVLEKEGHAKRYYPGGYKDLGIDTEPTKHLGNKASALKA